jgi:ATP-dependent protease HslVU (ClpYQ) ATPase subunit
MFATLPDIAVCVNIRQSYKGEEMNEPRGIFVYGANGSGKTTLGRELSLLLNFKRIDVEDYYFEDGKTEIPYSIARPKEDVIRLMLSDINKYRYFVLSSVICVLR